MADYYPLISRAVGALEKNNGENRRVIYDRARAALLAQLRGVTPPLDESDITRERLALEESVRKVEAESARQFVEATRQMSAARLRQSKQWEAPPKPRPAETRPAEPAPREERERYIHPPAALAREPAAPAYAPAAPAYESATPAYEPEAPRRAPPPPSMPDAEDSDSIFDRPFPAQPQPMPMGDAARREAGERRSLFDWIRKDRAKASEPASAPAAPVRAETSEQADEDVFPPPPRFERAPQRAERAESAPRRFALPEPEQQRGFEPHEEEARGEQFSEPMLESPYAVDDSRPPLHGRHAPGEAVDEEYAYEYDESDEEVAPRRSYARLIKPLAAALAVVVLAGVGVWQWPNMVTLYRSFRAPATTEVAREGQPPAAARPKITDRIEPGSPQTPATPAPSTQAGVSAAQKVVLYEEDPADPNGKRFVGSAIWRTETVTPGPGQPAELAIRADVEVPERKLAMTWSLRRNTDKGLPATHTVEIMFKVPADFPSGGISNVPGILMKQAEQTRGVPLAGLAVKVTPGFYLIGLSNVDADKDRNLQMLKERSWFDIPVVYNNNRRAILALEKGTPGERVFADAFKAWKQ
ncbi:MAG: hypothetical protein E6G86_03645 [Alphaproteobacteria bacterium]|nr:MAG: hypothetical protein E6G86_03645 [Alphaproteobacteria bacterium]